MSNLVYLMCSLPSLSYRDVPPITMDEFLQEAQSQLSRKSFRELEQVSLHEVSHGSGKGKLQKFTRLIDEIQKDLSELRAAKRQKRAPELYKLSRSMMDLNPLDRELAIGRWQWEELSSMEVGATFTMTELIAYKLKLELALRIFSFDWKEGAKVLDSVVNPSIKSED